MGKRINKYNEKYSDSPLIWLLWLATIGDFIFLFWGLHKYNIFGDNPYSWTTCLWESTKIGFWFIVIAWVLIIFWIKIGVEATAAVVGDTGDAAYEAIKELVIAIKDYIVDLFSVKSIVNQKCPSALKAKILEKKKNAVYVGVYNRNNQMTEKITINADMGVADDIRSGEVIELAC